MSKTMTNEEFRKCDPVFKKACEAANIEPTSRQASRWRNKKGIAYKVSKGSFDVSYVGKVQ